MPQENAGKIAQSRRQCCPRGGKGTFDARAFRCFLTGDADLSTRRRKHLIASLLGGPGKTLRSVWKTSAEKNIFVCGRNLFSLRSISPRSAVFFSAMLLVSQQPVIQLVAQASDCPLPASFPPAATVWKRPGGVLRPLHQCAARVEAGLRLGRESMTKIAENRGWRGKT